MQGAQCALCEIEGTFPTFYSPSSQVFLFLFSKSHLPPLFLQAQQLLKGISGAEGDPSELLKLQTSYLQAYMAFFDPSALDAARASAAAYTSYPVQRWRNLFTDVWLSFLLLSLWQASLDIEPFISSSLCLVGGLN